MFQPELSAVVALLGAFVSFLVWVAYRVMPRLRQIGHLLDDFTGESARPGLPNGRPGIVERVARIEGHLSRLDAIDAYLGINSVPAQRKP